LNIAQLMPLPLTDSCSSKIQIGFTFLVPAHLGSPRKGPLNGCVCVCVYIDTTNADIHFTIAQRDEGPVELRDGVLGQKSLALM